MNLNFETDFETIAKEDPYFSEDDEIDLNCLTDLAHVMQFFSSLHPAVEQKTLESHIHYEIKQKYYRNKYKLLALNDLPSQQM